MRWINLLGIVALAALLGHPVFGAEQASRASRALTQEAYEKLDQGDVDAAKSLFIKIVQRQGGDQDALQGLATCLYLKEDFALARRTLNIVLQLNETAAYAHALLGNILFREKDYAGAEQEFRRAIREDPKRPSFRNNLGVVLREKGDEAGAKAAFLEAVDMDSRYAEAQFNLTAMLVSGPRPDLREAHRHYRAAVKAGYPEHAQLEQLLK